MRPNPPSALATEPLAAEWASADPSSGPAPSRRAPAAPSSAADDKSAILDQAYEEYCRRREAGEEVDVEAFCARFPAYRSELQFVLLSHQFIGRNQGWLSEALLPEPASWPRPGDVVGDYTLLRELGRGAFARVFLAREAPTGDRPVALKLARESGSEARTLGRLSHDHIVPVLSAGQDGTGLHRVCMPFLGSATLNDVLDRAYPHPGAPAPRRAVVIRQAIEATARPDDPAPVALRPFAEPAWQAGSFVEGVVRLGAQLAEALAFLHAHKVHHRDLKPSNVLLSPDGRPLLLDFNLSGRADVPSPRLGGTLPYMAPEQAQAFLTRGRVPEPPGGPVDVFALGVILYELLTGKHPFGPAPVGQPAEELGPELLKRHRAGCPPLRRHNPAVPAALAERIERCLAFEPADRPGSAELAAGLRRSLPRPRRAVGLACLALLVVAACAAAGALLPSREPLSPAQLDRLGWDELRRGRHQQAEQAFQRAVQAYPEDWKGYYGLGWVELERARHLPADDPVAKGAAALASELFTRATSASKPPSGGPGAWQADFGRARAELLRHERAEAQRYLLAVYDRLKAPKGGRAPTGLGPTLACLAYCSASGKNHGLAVAWGKKALEQGFTSPAVLNNLGYSCLRAGRLGEALGYLDGAADSKPPLVAAHYNRAAVAHCLYVGRPPGGVIPPSLLKTACADIELVIRRREAQRLPIPRAVYDSAVKLYVLALHEEAQQTAALGMPSGSAALDLVHASCCLARLDHREKLRGRLLTLLDKAGRAGCDPLAFDRPPYRLSAALDGRISLEAFRRPATRVGPSSDDCCLVDPVPDPLGS
jgi:serine/threonine protein kinase/Flp pilus assembly protein TadD